MSRLDSPELFATSLHRRIIQSRLPLRRLLSSASSATLILAKIQKTLFSHLSVLITLVLLEPATQAGCWLVTLLVHME